MTNTTVTSADEQAQLLTMLKILDAQENLLSVLKDEEEELEAAQEDSAKIGALKNFFNQ